MFFESVSLEPISGAFLSFHTEPFHTNTLYVLLVTTISGYLCVIGLSVNTSPNVAIELNSLSKS